MRRAVSRRGAATSSPLPARTWRSAASGCPPRTPRPPPSCDSDWLDGCPVTSTVVGTATSAPDIQQAAAEAFARWRAVVAEKLRDTGFTAADAEELAHTVIATLEGAELAAQVARSVEPLEVAGRHLARLLSSYR
ncbi:TetR family transcriptional regulator C-terminal domain-containing protein [Streptomyces sp. NPDC056222]|uniref:LmrA/YxaF family transcription factor n=1 Tax=Streptomyces sp. NPDC056222 TaxID=3345749 RepID=UPI0035DA208B